MSSVDIFERVHKGEITSTQAADLLIEERERSMRPSRPSWLPRPIFTLGIALLALILPGLLGRRA